MITEREFLARRRKLLHSCKPDSVCVIPAATMKTRSRDTEYTFRQDSDFWYLTGFNEPQAWLLLSNHSRHEGEFMALVCQGNDPAMETWHGRRLGPAGALEQMDIDEAYDSEDITSVLGEWLDGHRNVYYALGENPALSDQITSVLTTLKEAPRRFTAPTALMDISPLIHEMRLYKSPSEIAIMRKACDISVQAHKRAMQFCQPGCFEYQLAGELHHEFAMHGATQPAYSTIVGAGENACILHYTSNCSEVNEDDLILIDAGCELAGYAADITRTFPACGEFSVAQQELYEVVLNAQEAVLDALEPGVTLEQLTQISVEVITKGLLDLGILHGELHDNLAQKSWQQYFLHGLGHYLGLDVHDVGTYHVDGLSRPLEPGMVITVEPGVYITSSADVDPIYHGMGIRIEDNVLITEDGIEILTQDMPKSVSDIESLMQKR